MRIGLISPFQTGKRVSVNLYALFGYHFLGPITTQPTISSSIGSPNILHVINANNGILESQRLHVC